MFAASNRFEPRDCPVALVLFAAHSILRRVPRATLCANRVFVSQLFVSSCFGRHQNERGNARTLKTNRYCGSVVKTTEVTEPIKSKFDCNYISERVNANATESLKTQVRLHSWEITVSAIR